MRVVYAVFDYERTAAIGPRARRVLRASLDDGTEVVLYECGEMRATVRGTGARAVSAVDLLFALVEYGADKWKWETESLV